MVAELFSFLFILIIIAFIAWLAFMSTVGKVADAMNPFHGGIHVKL